MNRFIRSTLAILVAFANVIFGCGSSIAIAQTVVGTVAVPQGTGVAPVAAVPLSVGGQNTVAPVGLSLTPGLVSVAVPTMVSPVAPAQAAQAVALPAAAAGRLIALQPAAVRAQGAALAAGVAQGKPAQSAAARLVARALPKVDFAAFQPGKLAEMPSAGVHGAGVQVMDQVLRRRSVGTGGDAEAVEAAEGGKQAGSGLAKAAQDQDGVTPRKTKHVIEPGVFSPHRLTVFSFDPEEYALTYIFGAEDPAPKGYELVVGLSVHRTMETVFGWLKAGKPGAEISIPEALAVYEKVWAEEIAGGRWKAKEGWKPSDYKTRGRDFLERRLTALKPFDKEGKIVSLEDTVRWNVTDPVTGKAYQFKGTIDRFMMTDDTIVIHDWKTHFNPPSIANLRRDDFQLGLYALALKQTRPDLVKGKKIKLVWDFKEFSQTIEVDDAYLAGVQDRVLNLLHGIETFTARVEAQRPEWEKRLKPAANPKGLATAKKQADAMGRLGAEIGAEKAELKALRARASGLEEGLAAYAEKSGAESAGDVTFERPEGDSLPTKSDDPEGYEGVASILKKAGLWEKYSTLSASALKAMAEIQGHPDHAVFQTIQQYLRSRHIDQVEVEAVEDFEAPNRWGGGVARPKLKTASSPDYEPEPGLYSPTQLTVFARDAKQYALQYLFRVKDGGPKSMDILVGLAVHETMEQLFTLLKGGRPASEIKLEDIITVYRERWAELSKEKEWEPIPGTSAATHKRRGEDFIRSKWKELAPFDGEGRVVYLERRMHFNMKDPRTGKVYRFQGLPDRVMIDGNTIVVHDWKTHWVPPTDQEIREKDFQLGLYVLALKQLFPDLMAGKKYQLIWDYRNKRTIIDADPAYLASVEKHVFEVLRGISALRQDVKDNYKKWKEIARPTKAPGTAAEADKWADDLVALSAEIKGKDAGIKAQQAEYDALESAVATFARAAGRTRVQGGSYVATVSKKGVVEVPTKGKERAAYDATVAALKAAGVWEKYSQQDLPALKKAVADEANPDQGTFEQLKPLMSPPDGVKVKLPRATKGG